MMVGTGPKKEDLLKILTKMNIEDEVIFTGRVEPQKIHKYYQAADIFVLPSYTEGLPVSVLEAMACGLPVVATNVGGIPEIITDRVNGFIVPSKNEKELIKKLAALTNNKDYREKFSQKSVEKINDEFNSGKKLKRLVDLYQNTPI
jgi:glycosyltransferase involved in cell wall biosynthesis